MAFGRKNALTHMYPPAPWTLLLLQYHRNGRDGMKWRRLLLLPTFNVRGELLKSSNIDCSFTYMVDSGNEFELLGSSVPPVLIYSARTAFRIPLSSQCTLKVAAKRCLISRNIPAAGIPGRKVALLLSSATTWVSYTCSFYAQLRSGTSG